MTRRGLRSALLPATVAAVLAAIVLSSAGGSAAAVESPRDAVAPFRPAGLNLSAARVPFFGAAAGSPVSAASQPPPRVMPHRASPAPMSSSRSTARAGCPGTITLHVESLPAEGAAARRHDARRRRPGSGIGHGVQPQRQEQRRALSRALPGLPDRRVRQSRHGQVGPSRLLGAAAVDDVRRPG